MKKTIYLISLLCFSLHANSQEIDYTMSRTGEYVLGVYLFIHCDPINEYDFVGKTDKFDIFKSDTKTVEKIIEKAKKKNPYFDGMIFKREFDHVELIKFKSKTENVAGFEVGMKVQYEAYGKLIQGVIVDIEPHKKRATVKYTDVEGKERLDGIDLKNLNKIN